MSIVTLKPGLLVSLSTRVEGGVKYLRVDLDAEKRAAATEEGADAEVTRWETTKIVDDPQAFERATKVRGKIRSMIASTCTHSAFGLLCVGAKEPALDEAIGEAHKMEDAFNEEKNGIRVSVYVLKGRIAETDQEATRAIASEMKSLIESVRNGIEQVDIGAIREAAGKAKKIGGMLDEETGRKVTAAVEQARAFAKDVVKRITEGEGKAEAAAAAVQSLKLDALEAERFAFLDLSEPVTTGETSSPVDARPVDMDEDEDGQINMPGMQGDVDVKAASEMGAVRALDL